MCHTCYSILQKPVRALEGQTDEEPVGDWKKVHQNFYNLAVTCRQFPWRLTDFQAAERILRKQQTPVLKKYFVFLASFSNEIKLKKILN